MVPLLNSCCSASLELWPLIPQASKDSTFCYLSSSCWGMPLVKKKMQQTYKSLSVMSASFPLDSLCSPLCMCKLAEFTCRFLSLVPSIALVLPGMPPLTSSYSASPELSPLHLQVCKNEVFGHKICEDGDHSQLPQGKNHRFKIFFQWPPCDKSFLVSAFFWLCLQILFLFINFVQIL